MDGEPTEELDAITDEFAIAPEILDDLPMESERENNGPPLVWLAAALVLLVGAVAVIFLIGQGRDGDDSASTSSLATSDPTTEVTPPIGDPAAGAAGGEVAGTTADTSPPDEGAPDSTSEATTTSDTSDQVTEETEADTTDTTGEEPSSSDQLVAGDAVVTSTADDFEIAISTNVCTTIEWSFTGDGQSASYTSEQLCFDDHLLSPRPEHPLLPGTEYQVTATFSAEGVSEVLVIDVTTAG